MNYLLPCIDRDQMIEVDRLMIEKYQISLVQMMENAGQNLARLVQHHCKNMDNPAILILCGNGHNGGGGMVCGRFLINWGYVVCLVTIGEVARRKVVTIKQYDTLQKMSATVLENDLSHFPDLLAHSDLVVDAMIGYGLDGDLSTELQSIIDALHKRRALPVISLDAPSGLDVSGKLKNKMMLATATLTLALPKWGLIIESNQSTVGELFLADIGVPSNLYAEMGLEVPTMFRKSPILIMNERGYFAPTNISI
ncbi:MAG: NAD(P)H-hydrate epimerase [Candidatus Marinimicrobia bacterium]|nr:NAD(P)H-hydrate epimerase [Candidatus Neomarinimicrobiota bacterium]